MGTPTWSHNGILCICNAFKDMVKVTFINGAQLGDVKGVFNAELHKERRRRRPDRADAQTRGDLSPRASSVEAWLAALFAERRIRNARSALTHTA
jgi:hypothetical protein